MEGVLRALASKRDFMLKKAFKSFAMKISMPMPKNICERT